MGVRELSPGWGSVDHFRLRKRPAIHGPLSLHIEENTFSFHGQHSLKCTFPPHLASKHLQIPPAIPMEDRPPPPNFHCNTLCQKIANDCPPPYIAIFFCRSSKSKAPGSLGFAPAQRGTSCQKSRAKTNAANHFRCLPSNGVHEKGNKLQRLKVKPALTAGLTWDHSSTSVVAGGGSSVWTQGVPGAGGGSSVWTQGWIRICTHEANPASQLQTQHLGPGKIQHLDQEADPGSAPASGSKGWFSITAQGLLL